MYQISRCIYRELEAEIVEDRQWGDGPSNHERVLRACEAAVHRLATDRHYFAYPSRTLFNDIRVYFPMSAQPHVFRVVDRYLGFAADYLASRPTAVMELTGQKLECRATTRRGTQCQRMPLPRNGYCPSHQHLAETEEVLAAA
ncbi:MAG TPA: hypothetical protein VKA57_05340 [Solirubrobacteraceae bacterium]|nr:hypothetical protein [Solirubrobacteraceae bacterium]